MLVIKKRTIQYNSSLYVGTALVSLLSIAAFLAVIHILPLLSVDRFAVVKEPKASTAPKSQPSPSVEQPGGQSLPKTDSGNSTGQPLTVSYAGSTSTSPTAAKSGGSTTNSAQPSTKPAGTQSQSGNPSVLSLSLPQLPNASVCGCSL